MLSVAESIEVTKPYTTYNLAPGEIHFSMCGKNKYPGVFHGAIKIRQK